MINKSTSRLGNILLSKGLITSDQLHNAISAQTTRRQELDPLDAKAYNITSLGEILIEMGYIDRLQLKRGLNWQAIVRKMTFAMSLCAPMLTISYGATAAVSSSVSSSSSRVAGSSLPLTIQAENYSDMRDVQAAAAVDTGGGLYVGWIDANDWMNYSTTAVEIPVTGRYKITYRVASLSDVGSLSFHEDDNSATYDTVTLPITGGWQTWVDVERTVTLTAGTHKFGLTAITGGFSLNWFKIESAEPLPVSPAATSSAAPSSVTPSYSLPLTLQAENYSAMSNVKALATTDTGGGFYVGWIDANDWLDFTNTPVNIPSAGNYKVTYRVASLWSGGSIILHEVGSTVAYDTASFPKTGGWNTWVDVQRTVVLSAGIHKFGITALTGGFNLNWFKIEKVSGLSSSSSVSPVLPSSVAASSKPASSAVASSKPVSSAASSSKPASSATASSKPASSVAASSKPASSSSSSSSASSRPANASSTSSSGVVSAQVAGPVEMNWVAPTKRENGSYLDVTELGGYELRYKLVTDTDFSYVTINDPWTTFYTFPWLEGNYIFQISAFDKSGRYSNFVDVLGY